MRASGHRGGTFAGIVRDTQPLPRDQRATARWVALIALLLPGCLNPRPEELPSAQRMDGPGIPDGPNGNNEIDAPSPASPAPVNPGASGDPSDEGPSEPVIDPDGGTDTPPDTGAADAGAADAADAAAR